MNLAVERFVSVGESIGEEHHDFKEDMCQACAEARQAGKNRLHSFHFQVTAFSLISVKLNAFVSA